MRFLLKVFYNLLFGLWGFAYDFKRFIKYSGWRHSMRHSIVRNYYAAIVYHGLEKSLSFKNRNPKSGWDNAFRMLSIIELASKKREGGYHDKAGRNALEQFINLPENKGTNEAAHIRGALEEVTFYSPDEHGVISFAELDYHKGLLASPEDFFLSRYSLREFKTGSVSSDVIDRAVKLAIKTPSVCNRRPWKVYHTDSSEVRDMVLSLQSGNRPFGKEIPNIMVVTTDLQAFFGHREHYQHWIEGGLFSMSLMYAFHSLGVAACALNWSQSPKNDRALRKLVNIDPHHTVIMMLAIGYPDKNNKVCASACPPLESVLLNLEKVK
jgi:Nitroreductase